MKYIICHAGSASNPNHQDGPKLACQKGRDLLDHDASALDAVILAIEHLEDDPRFNAGTGSNLRLDGKTIQMDASCMSSDGNFAAIAAIERVQNPIRVARAIMETPHILLVGDGATQFARQCGHQDYDPTTRQAKHRFKQIAATQEMIGEWSMAALKTAWNYDTPIHQAFGSDTVGCLAWDGKSFAAGLSSGGLTAVLKGRVGDVPFLGCGLYAGEWGAVALTGDGEYIARSLLAYRSYQQLEQKKLSLQQTLDWTLHQLPKNIDLGAIILNKDGFIGGARHDMAWFGCSDQNEVTP